MKTIDRIIFLLEEKDIVPAKMMKELGFSNGLFSQWKSGLQNPSAEKIFKIADYLGCSTDYLLGRTDIPTINGSTQFNGDNHNGIQANVNTGNVTVNNAVASSASSAEQDDRKLFDMIKGLDLVERSKIIIQIDEMKNKK